MSLAPNYQLPQYGLSEDQLRRIALFKRWPAWKRRKLHMQMSGGPKRSFVYRYLAFNPSDQLCMKKARDLIVESILYLPRPSDLNDPYDFRANVTLTQDVVERRQYFERTARMILASGKDPLPHVHGKQRKIEALVRRAVKKAINSPEAFNESFERVRDQNGVACFSEDPKGLLLWAHYSAGHTGICLQFDVTQDPGVLMLCQRVKYQDDLSNLIWPSDREDIVEKVILSKGRAWETEKEVRYVSLHVVGDSLPFDGKALRAIILGSRFPESLYGQIGQLIDDRVKRGLPRPVVYQAQQKKQKYGICLSRRRDP